MQSERRHPAAVREDTGGVERGKNRHVANAMGMEKPNTMPRRSNKHFPKESHTKPEYSRRGRGHVRRDRQLGESIDPEVTTEVATKKHRTKRATKSRVAEARQRSHQNQHVGLKIDIGIRQA